MKWNNIYIYIHGEFEREYQFRREFYERKIPVFDSDFGDSLPAKLVVSFGKKIPIENIREILRIVNKSHAYRYYIRIIPEQKYGKDIYIGSLAPPTGQLTSEEFNKFISGTLTESAFLEIAKRL